MAPCAVRMHRGRTTGVGGDIRPSLRNGFNGVLRALPGDRATVVLQIIAHHGPVGLRATSTNLSASVGAPEPHDFSVRNNIARPARRDRSRETRPAIRLARAILSRPPHSGPTSVTTRTPLIGPGCEQETTDLGESRSELFLRGGLDDPNQVERVWEIRFLAHGIFRVVRRLYEAALARFCATSESHTTQSNR